MLKILTLLDLDDRFAFSSGRVSKALTYRELSSDFSKSKLRLTLAILGGTSIFSSSFLTVVLTRDTCLVLAFTDESGFSCLVKILSKVLKVLVVCCVTVLTGWLLVTFFATFLAS